jgi:hypothetical protein
VGRERKEFEDRLQDEEKQWKETQDTLLRNTNIAKGVSIAKSLSKLLKVQRHQVLYHDLAQVRGCFGCPGTNLTSLTFLHTNDRRLKQYLLYDFHLPVSCH